MGKLPEPELMIGETENLPLFGFPDARDQSRKRVPLTFVLTVLRNCCTFEARSAEMARRVMAMGRAKADPRQPQPTVGGVGFGSWQAAVAELVKRPN